MRYTATVKYNEATDEHYLEFPDELMEQVGWNVGDTLKWTSHEDGSWSIAKKEDEGIGSSNTERNVPPNGTVT
jgi:hypothetical protein